MSTDEIVIQKIQQERMQLPGTRSSVYDALEKEMGVPVVSFFTSFKYPVMIEDSDADMLEGVLSKCRLSGGFALFLSSPGGNGLAAERIVNICRSYSGTGKYVVVVPGKAKSAATIICLGSSEIVMGKTSELGAIDPQVTEQEDGQARVFSVYNLVESYKDLFNRAVKEKGNLHPYLQQLEKYDEREIAELKSALELSEDMAIKALRTGMLSSLSEREIKKQIGIFLTPKKVKVHGRPISAEDAKNCNLNVKICDVKSAFWSLVNELHVRLNDYVCNNNVAKCVECRDRSFHAEIRGAQ